MAELVVEFVILQVWRVDWIGDFGAELMVIWKHGMGCLVEVMVL